MCTHTHTHTYTYILTHSHHNICTLATSSLSHPQSSCPKSTTTNTNTIHDPHTLLITTYVYQVMTRYAPTKTPQKLSIPNQLHQHKHSAISQAYAQALSHNLHQPEHAFTLHDICTLMYKATQIRHTPNYETHTSALALRDSQINLPHYVKSLVISCGGVSVLDLKELTI